VPTILMRAPFPRPGAHPASCTMGTGAFPGVKSGRGVTLTPHPLLVPWSWKGRAIPLLLLWAIRPVQILSACTMVQFTILLQDYGTRYKIHSLHGRTFYITLQQSVLKRSGDAVQCLLCPLLIVMHFRNMLNLSTVQERRSICTRWFDTVSRRQYRF
jgi:hypothetical protein